MRAPVSVVMVVRNAAPVLPFQLDALGEGLAEGLIRELILVDQGSTDATLEIAEAAGAVILPGPARRAEALARGLAEASGEWLLVPAPASIPAPGWTTLLLRHLERSGGQPGRIPARPLRSGLGAWLRQGRAWRLLPQGAQAATAAPRSGATRR